MNVPVIFVCSREIMVSVVGHSYVFNTITVFYTYHSHRCRWSRRMGWSNLVIVPPGCVSGDFGAVVAPAIVRAGWALGFAAKKTEDTTQH